MLPRWLWLLFLIFFKNSFISLSKKYCLWFHKFIQDKIIFIRFVCDIKTNKKIPKPWQQCQSKKSIKTGITIYNEMSVRPVWLFDPLNRCLLILPIPSSSNIYYTLPKISGLPPYQVFLWCTVDLIIPC